MSRLNIKNQLPKQNYPTLKERRRKKSKTIRKTESDEFEIPVNQNHTLSNRLSERTTEDCDHPSDQENGEKKRKISSANTDIMGEYVGHALYENT